MKDRTLPLHYLRDFFGLREFYLPSARDHCRALQLLAEASHRCRRCALGGGRTHNVPGWGNAYARLMLVGEAPGADEDRLGKPFVGKAGEVLTRLLAEAGIDRERDLYLTNVVKCRPPGNRDPLPGEISACLRFLSLQVEIISPDLILCLGRWSARTLLGLPLDDKDRTSSLGSLRGRAHRSILGPDLIVTYHPSFVARNEEAKPEVWKQALSDIRLVVEKLGW